MKTVPDFDLTLFNPVQRQRMNELLESARRAVAVYQPQRYREAMEEAFRYFVTHHPEMDPDRQELEEMVAVFLDGLPRVSGWSRKRLTAFKLLILLILGLGGAYTFIYLYFNRSKHNLSEGLLFGGLVLLSFTLMALPMFFSRRKKG